MSCPGIESVQKGSLAVADSVICPPARPAHNAQVFHDVSDLWLPRSLLHMEAKWEILHEVGLTLIGANS